jgi:septal ring factor EnvC (AmiA/AmiB activator)
MDIYHLLHRLDELEARVRAYEAKELQWLEKEQKLLDRIAELEETNKTLEAALKYKADSKAAKKPNINFGVDRNKPDKKNKKKKRRKQSSGRVPDAKKVDNADSIVDIFPENTAKKKCLLQDEQFVWRLIDGKAKYIHYRIYAPEKDKNLPKIPGVRNRRSEYGIEIIIALAFLV